MKSILIGATALLVSSAAFAQLSSDGMQKIDGLAEIVAAEKHCGFAINQERLEQYLVDNSLATAESISFYTTAVRVAERPRR
jgi:hypothetical protein